MNPLLEKFTTKFETTPFSKIKEEHFLPAIIETIAMAKKEINAIKDIKEKANFKNTIVALEKCGRQLDIVAEIFFNLNSAETNDKIQALAQEISPLLSEFSNDIQLDVELFKQVKQVYDDKTNYDLDKEDSRLLEKTYKGFVRNGALLSKKDKDKLREIDKRKSKLALDFGEHVLHETANFELEIVDKKQLAGLPKDEIEAAKMIAKEKGKEDSWIFTLDYPSYVPFMKYLDDKELREKMYRAYGSKAFKGDENDNKEIVKQIAKSRYERANLLSFKTHSDFVLAERMAEKPEKVNVFLSELLQYSKPAAEKEKQELADFAKIKDGTTDLKPWDIAYYSEKLRKEKFDLDEEMLKPYFKLENVVDGVFAVAQKLYGLNFEKQSDIDTYHKDVDAYKVTDNKNKYIGIFYTDFFPRKGKRGGAWMTSYRGQYIENGVDNRPHVSIVCNFTKPTETKPSLLTFNEVTTIFHEFGHSLHGLLANGKYESLSGTNVYWDFVELPSQLMENWAYEPECLNLFAKHYKTGEIIPTELIQKIKDTANFRAGSFSLRQLSLGILDMAWHSNNPSEITDVETFENDAMKETKLYETIKGNNMSCQFSHIFQGGYSSGYYSYKWAEVLDADAFEYFKENGIFNSEIANSFLNNVLSKGGSEHPMKLYKRFRGQEPSPLALLRREGLV